MPIEISLRKHEIYARREQRIREGRPLFPESLLPESVRQELIEAYVDLFKKFHTGTPDAKTKESSLESSALYK
jgi:hypothetical protein